MRRTPLTRTTRVRPKRRTPRRRTAPRWDTAAWEAANEQLAARCLGRCECCGNPLEGRVERAHRLKRRDGGDRLSNLLLMHPECHAWTHANPAEAERLGLILRTHQDPTTTPLLWCNVIWLLIDDQGRTQPTE